ncbi:MAG: CehA/McbA family metallohydrolase [Candidatus Latescibacterota bacterium]|nr:CehA/McbA family metallohydrolase [Candidatus Latescibacterota bacterium]
MYEKLAVSYEGQTELVATDQECKPLRIFVACPQGLEAGADVRITISTFHSSNRQWTLANPFVEGGEGVVVLGHGLARDWTDMTRGGDGPAGGGLVGRPINELYLCTIQVTKALAAGARLVFPFGVVPSPHAAIAGDLQVRVRRSGSEVFDKVCDPIPLRNGPGPLARLEGRVSASADAQGKRRAVVYATDANFNPLPRYRGGVSLQADGEVAGLPAEVEIGEDGRGVVEGIEVQGDGPVRITVRDAAHGLKAKSGPARTVGERQHYFGGIHFHTRLSVDGDREPREAYAYARDHLNLDVVAMTDHAPIGAGWQECLAVNEEFYDPGRLVTIPAWESSNAYGHANLYLRTPEVDGGTWNWKPDLCPSEVTWDQDVVVVPHHPNCGQLVEYGQHREVMGKSFYWSKYHWEFPNERARLVEIVQGRGNFEADAPDDYWGIRLGEQSASVQDALAQGWRLGFVAGTDNHQGHPTLRPGGYTGMTCFRATELTREAVWQAMDERFTYATSGVPIVCDYAVNGVRSGAEGRLAVGEGVHFSAQLHGTAPIEVVEIISGGQCVWQGKPDAWDVELDGVELPVPEGDSAYYYLRLRQADGHRAWLSPVWLDATK